MESLIRSPRLDPARRRLSDTREGSGRGGEGAEPASHDIAQSSTLEILRDEIEQRVRAELADLHRDLEEAERSRARAQGHEQGLSEGLSEGRSQAAAEVARTREELTQQVRSTLDSLEQAHASALATLQSQVGEVAFAALCRLLSRAALSQAFVLSMVKETCARLHSETVATARLHPRDIRLLQELVSDQELRLQSLAVRLVPDETLGLGGCIIESAAGQFDGGLENQLRRLHAVLTDAAVDGSAVTRK